MNIVIGLGANLGSRTALLRLAEQLLGRHGQIRARSADYQTPALTLAGIPPGPDYVNGAVLLSTPLAPKALLQEAHAIEAMLGRERHARWADRTLDLDLLWAWHETEEASAPLAQPFFDDGDLQIPHPSLLERPFALAPLLDVLAQVHMSVRPLQEALADRHPPFVQPPQLEVTEERIHVQGAMDRRDALAFAWTCTTRGATWSHQIVDEDEVAPTDQPEPKLGDTLPPGVAVHLGSRLRLWSMPKAGPSWALAAWNDQEAILERV